VTLNSGKSVTSSIDFDAEGKQHGHLNLPHSSNASAWGAVRLPVTVLKNGDGPTVTFIAGNHGDEYEGPLALLKLASELDIAEVSGRIILVPCLNAPAVAAASRLSPIVNLNMNRIFPGWIYIQVEKLWTSPRWLQCISLTIKSSRRNAKKL